MTAFSPIQTTLPRKYSFIMKEHDLALSSNRRPEDVPSVITRWHPANHRHYKQVVFKNLLGHENVNPQNSAEYESSLSEAAHNTFKTHLTWFESRCTLELNSQAKATTYGKTDRASTTKPAQIQWESGVRPNDGRCRWWSRNPLQQYFGSSSRLFILPPIFFNSTMLNW